MRGRTLTGKEGPEGQGLLQPFPELGGNFRLCAVDQKRPFFPRAGPFLAFLPFKEAYGKAGPLREAPYGEGRSLQAKDDEEAYGPYEGKIPYGEEPLRERKVLKARDSCSHSQNWAGISACVP